MRNMKKLFFAAMPVLALCLALPLSVTADAKESATNAATAASGAAVTGTCYQLARCSKAFTYTVTQNACWNAGGNSWKQEGETLCIDNPNPE